MSALQKSIVKSRMPPRCPKTAGVSKLAPMGGDGGGGGPQHRHRDYAPVSWRQYFARFVDVQTAGGSFRVYLSPEPEPEPKHPQRLRVLTLHGGGYSALSWALFTKEITTMMECQVVALDLRGHGDTHAHEPDDLSADTLVRDVWDVVRGLWGGGEDIPPLLLVGHSLGGAVAVRAGALEGLQPHVRGVVVLDVVEGSAMEALAHMRAFLRGRPTHFASVHHAVEWCVRSGQVRNVASARVSMPGQIVRCDSGQLAASEVEAGGESPPSPPAAPRTRPARRQPPADRIAEEPQGEEEGEMPAPAPAPAMRYTWRIDLGNTAQHWAGWFSGLSSLFLSVPAPKLLLLANIDGLDRDLTVGQMQGKFQLQVLPRCGHAVHEDAPAEVARAVAGFALRHRLTEPTASGQHMDLRALPGC